MNPIAAGLMFAVVIATGFFGRHVETTLRQAETDFRNAKAELQEANLRVIETALYLNTDHATLYCPKASESPYEATSVTFFSHHGLVAAFESMGFRGVGCLSIIRRGSWNSQFPQLGNVRREQHLQRP